MTTIFLPLARAMPPATAPGFTVIWFAVVLAAVLVSLVAWDRVRERTYLHYAAYVGGMGLMSLNNQVLAAWWVERIGELPFVCLNNLLHLPYAVFYLLFVLHYFRVHTQWPRWARFGRVLLGGYAVALLWWATDCLRGGPQGSEWAILICNAANLLSSLVLAGLATYAGKPGAREFLYACLPLTMSGLVLVAQFVSDTGPGGEPGLAAFRTGFILHVMLFLLALSVRDRGLRQALPWQE